ncbi:MAG: tRNA (adenosine(37)-N6)-threonylcarbamoyltransferase complex ATPase subunit type 1 TsaE [Bacillota bacterium]|jgi:tRNA threonylcarbamoyladenosine biosynthesis protein TsaE|nr:tRNA (adenosine(37)-N6)-threonylcarbamoyltransferase complex ATPase subunit type 1 TsaE [Clostridia bacterium]
MQTKEPEETFALGERLAAFLYPGTVVALTGELGAGKTLFAQGVAKGLGVKEHVTSPTFTIINEYQGHLPFYHIDAYRLEGTGEIDELGLEEYFNSSGVVLIEWPERIQDYLPSSFLRIHLDKEWDESGQEIRVISFFPVGSEWENVIGEFEESENTRN